MGPDVLPAREPAADSEAAQPHEPAADSNAPQVREPATDSEPARGREPVAPATSNRARAARGSPAREPAAETPGPTPEEDTMLAEGERYVEEELPPGFWEQDPAPKPRGASRPKPASRAATADEEAPAPEYAPADYMTHEDTVPEAEAEAATPEDTAFATLQQLFPGRVIAVESLAEDSLASEDDPAEPGSLEAPEAPQSGEGIADEAGDQLEP